MLIMFFFFVYRKRQPSNILLDADCRCKIADFGLARSLVQDAEEGQPDNVMTDYVATRWYRAPEILLASKRYAHYTAVDCSRTNEPKMARLYYRNEK